MSMQNAALKFRALVDSSVQQREEVRTLVHEGKWRQAEPDPVRRDRFKIREKIQQKQNGRESIQGESIDWLDANFFTKGDVIKRAVGYVTVLANQFTRSGSGFMISPKLFMTNHHVVEDIQQARQTKVTFNREVDEAGRDLPVTVFRLDPDAFFITSEDTALDFTIVAIADREFGELSVSDLGYFILSDAPDKHVLGMSVNIIQYPLDLPKKVTFRNNSLVYRTDNSLLYETDTEACSSGSPVCNDFWDLVAIHHWGEPYLAKRDNPDSDLPNTVNEGIRISAVYKFLNAQLESLTQPQHELLLEALSYAKLQPAVTKKKPSREPTSSIPKNESLTSGNSPATSNQNNNSIQKNTTMQTANNEVKMIIPIEITIRVAGGILPAIPEQPEPKKLSRRNESLAVNHGAEANKIDTDYSNRSGYAEDFIIGTNIPMPRVVHTAQIAPLKNTETDFEKGELHYEHFSLILNKTKRCAFYTATNIDGDTYKSVNRKTGAVTPRGDSNEEEGETWYNDGRIDPKYHLNQALFSAWSHLFDRGHLTRRTDPSWGPDAIALRADADTFHFSNCSLQHFRFNQTIPYWQGAERYILENGLLAPGITNRLTVFQGPLYSSADYFADDFQIPSKFFKIAFWKGAQGFKAIGLVVDQSGLLTEERSALGQPKPVKSVNIQQWRVPIAEIEHLAGLDFGDTVRSSDTIGNEAQPQPGAEAFTKKPIYNWDDLLQ